MKPRREREGQSRNLVRDPQFHCVPAGPIFPCSVITPFVNGDRRQLIVRFVDWAAKNIKGDEKGEAQIFLDRLFQAFGQKGSLDVGGSPEMRIRKAADDGGGTSFADYVWKPVVLIEMKKRGVDLRKHYRQAFDYWTRLVPDRPRYVILCNFDQFDVYDFDRQVDTPVDTVPLTELPDRYGPLAFLFPTQDRPIFGNDREKVTREAADRLATCYTKLATRKVPADLCQRFILQCLVALFAEDIGLLERYTLTKLVRDCRSPSDSYDLIGGLFEAMNRPGGNSGGRYKGVRYFNGGIFAQPARVELHEDELAQIREACNSDWSKVSPEIFGTLFEHSMGKDARHAFGAHYTSQIDILKIVHPTIVDPWTAAIERARSGPALLELLQRLATLRVLDPACGSGNFLYLAYREMKRLETRIRERLLTEFPTTQATLVHVNARQFFGMDINHFAIELAKVTMMLGRKLAIDELHISDEADLPLDNLDENFCCVDALLTKTADGGAIQTPWPAADVIIGNPPFLGAKQLKPEHGADYANALRKLYPNIPGMADFCVYWIRRAHDHLPACIKADPLAGRAGLVGTQNIRNNQSRVGGLDYVVASGTIVEAVDSQPWSGEANVNVSIVDWIKSKDEALIPRARHLWSKVETAKSGARTARKGTRADKKFELKDLTCDSIGPALSHSTDVTLAETLRINTEPQRCFTGQMVGHERFLLTAEERDAIVRKDANNKSVIFPHLTGDELLSGSGKPIRFVIDFGLSDQLAAQKFAAALQWVRQHVLPDRERKAEEGKTADGKLRPHHKQFLSRWWQLAFPRGELLSWFQRLPRYVVCSRVTKRPIFVFVESNIRPGDALSCFAFDDDYSFSILQANPHWRWFVAKSSKLTERLRYTPDSVFDTFPWPQSPTKRQIDVVAAAGREVRRVRAEALKTIEGGLRAVYRSLELPGKHPLKDAHAALDAAVLAAYGFDPKADLLKQILDLNHSVAESERMGRPVTAPGVPKSYGDPANLITGDCVRPE
jgi:SAM-dependent methyltransferase